jgi:hypothetical protein
MPRKSDRKRLIDFITAKVERQKKEAFNRALLEEEDSDQDDRDASTIRFLRSLKKKRYVYRKCHYRKNRRKFDLQDALSYDSVHYNEEEFLFAFRMKRESFLLLLEQMKTRKAFKKTLKFKKQRPIAYQLLVFLFRVGKEGIGGSASAVSSHFGIGKGSVINYVKRCVSALHEIKEEVIHWPNEEERDEMKARLATTGFRHCVGIIDGTLIVLDFRPEKFHECYYSRKSCYALNVLVVCDDKKRITFYLAGWPGSTHDNRVFRNCKLFLQRDHFFSRFEYLLGDSAYSCSSIMVQAFKKLPGRARLPVDQEFFNTRLAKVRISSEHCIGILKGRFGCLKRSNIKFKQTNKEVKELVNIIGACIVLHNLLINYDENDIPHEWYDEMRDNIDWSLYNEETYEKSKVTDEDVSRRETVFESIINNYYL